MLKLDPPVLTGDHVLVRPWRVGDAPALVAAWSDPAIIAGSTPPDDRSVEAATRWIERADLRAGSAVALDLVVADPLDDRVMGEVGISRIDPVRQCALMGWWVAAADRGRHVATEAVTLTSHWLLSDGGFRALLAEIGAANEASRRVAVSAGFAELKPPSGDRPAMFASTA